MSDEIKELYVGKAMDEEAAQRILDLTQENLRNISCTIRRRGRRIMMSDTIEMKEIETIKRLNHRLSTQLFLIQKLEEVVNSHVNRIYTLEKKQIERDKPWLLKLIPWLDK